MDHRPPLLLLAAALFLSTASLPARAQHLIGVGGGQVAVPVPAPPRAVLPPIADRTLGTLPDAVRSVSVQARQLQIRRQLRRHRDVLDTDPAGAPVVRNEVVAIDPSPQALELARAAGFTVVGERRLEELGLHMVVLRARSGMGTRAALRRLRRLDPAGQYEFNHLYHGSSGGGVAIAGNDVPQVGAPIRVGLIDSGVSPDHPALDGVEVRTWGCDGRRIPEAHGTAVASLLAGTASGTAAAGTTLFAADIYCGRPTGGAVTGFVEAMAWLARERVGVINLSLVGPHNALLQRATRALAERGHVLVAAVGNDGPAAPPLFPAAYPDVIGVTAVDRRERVLPEAGRGDHVEFAAPGSDLQAARPEGGREPVRGTSFAAPLVSRIAALHAPEPSADLAARVRVRLGNEAVDLGRNGRDDIYGYGLLGRDAVMQQADAAR